MKHQIILRISSSNIHHLRRLSHRTGRNGDGQRDSSHLNISINPVIIYGHEDPIVQDPRTIILMGTLPKDSRMPFLFQINTWGVAGEEAGVKSGIAAHQPKRTFKQLIVSQACSSNHLNKKLPVKNQRVMCKAM